jgi:hypothetical protein
MEEVMGLFMRPRRPMMRMAAGAATAGVAYHAGKKHAEQEQYNEQASQAPPPPAPAAPAPAAAPSNDPTAELERLGQLHAQGVLSDDEFTAAKAKVLGI